MPTPEELLEARRWLGAAHDELRVIDVLLADDRAPGRAACFHAHLATEKALKALLIFRNVAVTKTHDLVRLHQLLPVDDANRFTVTAFADLNPWAVDGRYPPQLDEPTPDAIHTAARTAQRAVAATQTIFDQEPDTPQ